jgi:hypothetical protein
VRVLHALHVLHLLHVLRWLNVMRVLCAVHVLRVLHGGCRICAAGACTDTHCLHPMMAQSTMAGGADPSSAGGSTKHACSPPRAVVSAGCAAFIHLRMRGGRCLLVAKWRTALGETAALSGKGDGCDKRRDSRWMGVGSRWRPRDR